ncbi:aminotransferase class IV, partial [Escherichia coli]|uniref:aminotransferase class IV n=1 Tax=Escherichia coli TaxID=562 RepID=UPI000A4E5A4F
KSLNYLNNILVRIEAKLAGVQEALMLNDQGYVAEGSGDNVFIVKENKQLHLQVEGLSNNLKASHQINAELRERNKELHTKIGSLQAHINDLKINVKVLYQQTKKVFKEQFKTFRGLVKNELVGREVEDYFEREHKNEMTKQRGYDMER